MKIEMRSPAAITPYENNPRQNDGAVDAVAKSIREFGFRVPLVVDEAGVVITGHTRLKAAQKLGLSEVPVHVATGMSPAQARGFRIADNATAEIAAWDKTLLPAELEALKLDNFDLSLLGFDDQDLAKWLGNNPTAGLCDADDVPDAPVTPITHPGDLWILGDHRVLCGDATKREDVNRLMNGRAADLWLTDPPYNVAYVGKTKDALTIQNDSLDDAAFRTFLTASFTNAFSAMKPGAAFYVWHADSEGFNFRGAVRDCGEQVRQCLVWNKNSMVMGRQDYHWKHEPCLYGWKSGASHGWYSDRCQTTVLDFDRPARSEEHPTMKAVALFAYQIGNSTAPQGLVLDTFLGSGTTLLASQQLGRTCYGLELSPAYVDVCVSRWEKFTGRKAERVESTTA